MNKGKSRPRKLKGFVQLITVWPILPSERELNVFWKPSHDSPFE